MKMKVIHLMIIKILKTINKICPQFSKFLNQKSITKIFMIRQELSKSRLNTSKSFCLTNTRQGQSGMPHNLMIKESIIHSLSKVTVEFYPKTIKSKSRQSFVNRGSKVALVFTVTLAPLLMGSMNFKKRSTFLQDTRQNYVSSFMRTIFVPTVTDASSFTPKKQKT